MKVILSGVYINQEVYISYNDEVYWIGKKLMDRINKIKPSLKMEDLGLSYYEKINPQYYDNMKFFKNNIKHLVDTAEPSDIGIIS